MRPVFVRCNNFDSFPVFTRIAKTCKLLPPRLLRQQLLLLLKATESCKCLSTQTIPSPSLRHVLHKFSNILRPQPLVEAFVCLFTSFATKQPQRLCATEKMQPRDSAKASGKKNNEENPSSPPVQRKKQKMHTTVHSHPRYPHYHDPRSSSPLPKLTSSTKSAEYGGRTAASTAVVKRRKRDLSTSSAWRRMKFRTRNAWVRSPGRACVGSFPAA